MVINERFPSEAAGGHQDIEKDAWHRVSEHRILPGFKFAALAFATFGLAGMWFAIFADVGVAAIAIINGTRAYGRTL